MNTLKNKVVLLQQAIWQLRDAKETIGAVLGDTDSGQMTMRDIDEIIADLNEDLNELSM